MAPTQKPTILIVEDDVQLRLLLSTILTQSGYSVRSAEDGFSALAEIRNQVPDLILSDLYMSGMSGFEFLSVVRRRFTAVRVIAMSSAFSGGEVPAGIAADAFFEKATSVVDLLHMVERMTRPDALPSVHDPSALAPLWIDAPTGESYVMMTCPECLRPFPQVLGKAITPIQEAGCVYCRSLVHYAIVQPIVPAPVQAFQRSPDAESSMPLSVSALS